MSRFVWIGKEGYRVEGEEHFARILEEKLGDDAAELFREYIRHYQYGIEEALIALDDAEGTDDYESITNAIQDASDALKRVMW